ncbi:MAG: nickel pincer cofactor biosynthesis protein LarB [Gammaproteobacteria bacterium]|nr:nickel pincer cofactor biosynthesis protein LarB [Gammaproteobacteria bacterium]
MNEVRFDWDRAARTGVAEAVFAEGKSNEQILSVLRQALEKQHPVLITRLTADQFEAARPHCGDRLDYDPVSRTAIYGEPAPLAGLSRVGIVCAGTSDLPVALEAQRCLAYLGIDSRLYPDAGVAGLWRLMSIADELRQHPVLIAVAGMEGSLFSVLSGLVPGIVIAVPTSIGYGVASGGRVALQSALASCSPGVVCVNIDNGFGAAAAARKMLLTSHGRSEASPPAAR